MIVDNKGIVAKVQEAVTLVQKGLCKRVDVNDDIKVYSCKNIIRIDISNEVNNGKEKQQFTSR